MLFADLKKSKNGDLSITISNKVKYLPRDSDRPNKINKVKADNFRKFYFIDLIEKNRLQHDMVTFTDFLRIPSVGRQTLAEPERSSQSAHWKTITTEFCKFNLQESAFN